MTCFLDPRTCLAALCSAVLLAGCASSNSTGNGSPAHTARTLLASKRMENIPLTSAHRAYAVTYRSTAANGTDQVPVNGMVAIPKGKAPLGGFPVVSWANGTTGVASQCPPSAKSNADRDRHLNAWLDRGYAVLMTDYYGWGNYGLRPDNHGRSNAAAMYDIVAAAHELPDLSLRDDWFATGHSQGGGASIWAAGTQTDKAYPLRGAIALAPTGPGVLEFMNGIVQGNPAGSAAPFISISVLAAQVVDPALTLDSLVSPPFREQVEKAREVCLDELFALPALKAGAYLKPGAGYDRFVRFIQDNDPSGLILQVPVLIVQGDRDETTVKPASTQKMMDQLCRNGATVTYREYAGVDHRGVMSSAQQLAFDFADALLANQHITDNYCVR